MLSLKSLLYFINHKERIQMSHPESAPNKLSFKPPPYEPYSFEFLLNKTVELGPCHSFRQYFLTIKEDRVLIVHRPKEPSLLSSQWIQLFYKIEDGQVQWKDVVESSKFSAYDFQSKIFTRSIKFDMEWWLSVPGRVPIQLYHVHDQVVKYDRERRQKRWKQMLEKQAKKKEEEKVKLQKFKEEKVKQQKFKEEQLKNIKDIECIFCAVYLDPQAEEKVFQLNCGHCYHKSCITKYCRTVKNQCPTCRYTPSRKK